MYDISIPKYVRTGAEKTIGQITAPDERNSLYNGLTVEDIQAGFLQADKVLSPRIPSIIKQRLEIARDIAVSGWFHWELYSVSLFWSLTSLEMALKHRFYQINPPPYQITKRKQSKTISTPFNALEKHLCRGWHIKSLPDFNGSFRGLLEWAVNEKLIVQDTEIILQEIANGFNNRFTLEIFPEEAQKEGLLLSDNPTLSEINNIWNSLSDDEKRKFQYNNAQILVEEIPKLRNDLAHPNITNWNLPPRSAIDGYWQVVEILNQLWK